MYHVCYVLRVPSANVEALVRVTADVAAVYRAHGAVGSTLARVTDASARGGCGGLADAVPTADDEVLMFGTDSFADAPACRAVCAAIDADPRTGPLYRSVCELVDLGRAVRWEAED